MDDIVKNAPSHLKAQMQAELDDLIKRNVVIRIPHRGGYKVYINPTYRKKIEAHLKKVFKFI